MKTLTRIIALGAVAAMVACGSSLTPTTADNVSMISSSPSGMPVASEVKSPDIAAIMFAANQGEIDQATAALPKLSSSDVRDFAQMMIRDHTDALTNVRNIMSTNHIIQHEAASDAIQLRNQSKQLVTNYNTASGTIDRSYMADQVRVHEKLLNMLDASLIPSSRGDVRTLLEVQRGSVAAHLDRARAILTNLP
jgi:putative membrane protein